MPKSQEPRSLLAALNNHQKIKPPGSGRDRPRKRLQLAIQMLQQATITWLIKAPTWLIVLLTLVALVLLDLWIAADDLNSMKTVFSVLLDRVEVMGVLAAVVVFLKEAPDRLATKHYEAWKAIDGAHGIKVSYARYQAFQQLCRAGVSLRGLQVAGADLNTIDLRKADLSFANFRDAQFQNANLSFANLREIDLSGADLLQVDLRGADLRGADLRGANLNGANLSSANLSGANLSRANLKIADLRFAVLRGVELRESNLKGANLRGADLGLANLTQANLSQADLSKTDLSQSNCRNAVLSLAKLHDGLLCKTNFIEADFWGAELDRSDVRGANFGQAQGLTPGQVKTTLNWEQATYDEGFQQELTAPVTATSDFDPQSIANRLSEL